MNVFVACEFSGTVRNAFQRLGHDAVSCDLLESDDSSLYHWQGDMFDVFDALHAIRPFDLVVAFPPCTYLAVSGAAHFKRPGRQGKQDAAVRFVKRIAALPVSRIAIENPIGVLSTRWRKPDQIIQPWQYGHPTTKATCLWLKNLPLLEPTKIVGKGPRQYYASGRSSPLWHAKSGAGCGQKRSITFEGIAQAMADQWGDAFGTYTHIHHKTKGRGK